MVSRSGERRRQIAAMLNEHGQLSISDFATVFNVSEMTVRRDLDALDRTGAAKRVRGGALPAGVRLSFPEREISMRAEKVGIAQRIVDLVEDGDSVLLDIGTTMLFVARELTNRRNLTLWTNSLNAAVALSNASFSVNLVGGQFHGQSEASLIGPVAEETISRFHVDKAILGAGGLHPRRGLVYLDLAETQVRRAMVATAKAVIVGADHTKFGRDDFASLGPLSIAHTLVTDRRPPAGLESQLQESRVEVLITGPAAAERQVEAEPKGMQ